MPKINKTKFAILGILNRGPASGYDIKKYSDKSIAFFWNENYGHIYPVLKKMTKEDLITCETKITFGKPSRNIFTITEKGMKELVGWLVSPIESQPVRNELLLKMVFSKDVSLDTLFHQFESYKKNLTNVLNELKNVEKQIIEKDNFSASKYQNLWLSAVKYGILDINAKISWIEESYERLKNFKE